MAANSKLSTHFTLAEFCNSQTAARLRLDNAPPPDLLPALIATARGMEQVRALLDDRPIFVSSGYRSPNLNAYIRGSDTSQHCKGEAVDFTCPSYGSPADIVKAIAKSAIAFDQLILEFYDAATGSGWVHISFSKRNRRTALVINQSGTKTWQA